MCPECVCKLIAAVDVNAVEWPCIDIRGACEHERTDAENLEIHLETITHGWQP